MFYQEGPDLSREIVPLKSGIHCVAKKKKTLAAQVRDINSSEFIPYPVRKVLVNCLGFHVKFKFKAQSDQIEMV